MRCSMESRVVTGAHTSAVIAAGLGGAWSSHHSCAVSALSCRAATSATATLTNDEKPQASAHYAACYQCSPVMAKRGTT